MAETTSEATEAADDQSTGPEAGGVTSEIAARPEAHQGPRGHHRGNPGSWIAVALIILGFALGAFALPTHSLILWITTGAALVAGGLLALKSRIMEQTH